MRLIFEQKYMHAIQQSVYVRILYSMIERITVLNKMYRKICTIKFERKRDKSAQANGVSDSAHSIECQYAYDDEMMMMTTTTTTNRLIFSFRL